MLQMSESRVYLDDPRWLAVRGLIRRYVLDGDVDLRLSEGTGGHSNVGLDTSARLTLVSALTALSCIRATDRRAHQLLVREIGEPCWCRGRRRIRDVYEPFVRRDRGEHCHRVSMTKLPLIRGMDWRELDEETGRAIAWLLSVL